MQATSLRTGFIGLGAMGYSMAANLSKAGLLETVWNRSNETQARFCAEHGVTAAASIADVAHHCDVILICVSADADLLDVVAKLVPALKTGAIVIDSSTIASETARAASTLIADAGGDFLDAPISGGTEGAKNGTLTFMVGGNEQAFARAAPVFKAMGKNIAHMGASGAGQATKAVNQVMCAGITQAVTEALAFATALDLPLDKVVDVVGSGAAGNWFVNQRGKTMVRDEYTGFGFKLALHHKDLGICLRMAEANGGALPLSQQTMDEYQTLMQDGHGDEDISALFRLKRDLFKAKKNR